MASNAGLSMLRAETLRHYSPNSEVAAWIEADERGNVIHWLREQAKDSNPTEVVHANAFAARWQCFV